jgi:hypothetical protein
MPWRGSKNKWDAAVLEEQMDVESKQNAQQPLFQKRQKSSTFVIIVIDF